MNKIVYYVGISLDGFISGPNEDISKFASNGEAVEKYLKDLKDYRTVIMGRKTYEFGYKYGLKPGQPAYGHMEHFIFSDSLTLSELADSVHIEKPDIPRIREIRNNSETDVYLCGGGQFAGWLLENELIDILKVKLNPIVLGEGVNLFGNSSFQSQWDLIEHESFKEGIQILTYKLRKVPEN